MTTPDEPPAAGISVPPSERDELAVWAFTSEALGVALFTALRDRSTSPTCRVEFDLLRQLEEQTLAVAWRLLVQLGVEVPGTELARSQGLEAGAELARRDVADLLVLLEAAETPVRRRYQRLLALVPSECRPLVDALDRHEVAVGEYSRRAMREDADPAGPVRDLLKRDDVGAGRGTNESRRLSPEGH